MAIYGFSTFGYEGMLVNVEVDLRRGIPAVDLVGLADGMVHPTLDAVRGAFRSAGAEFPGERVLVSLSPADVKKDYGFDLAIACGIHDALKHPEGGESVLVMGDLECDGMVRDVNGVRAALQTASAGGIRYAIVPYGRHFYDVGSIGVFYAGDFADALRALDALRSGDTRDFLTPKSGGDNALVSFDDVDGEESIDNVKGLDGMKYAMTVAVAGMHNILAYGAPGCGKTLCLEKLPQIMPRLTSGEKASVDRIYSLAGLEGMEATGTGTRPFRMPHQTASIEGMCGGGVHCRPGEISLAHNGVLFLDEAAEFRSSVLQMLRVPLENGSITLSRAGRTTTYPSRFMLAMAANPCPCGNYGSKDKVCLCSLHSVQSYWRKFSAPLLSRVAIRVRAENYDRLEKMTLEGMRGMIRKAWERQYERQGKPNERLDNAETERLELTDAARHELELADLEWRERIEVIKLARTLADIYDDVPGAVDIKHVVNALRLHGSIPVSMSIDC